VTWFQILGGTSLICDVYYGNLLEELRDLNVLGLIRKESSLEY